MKTLIVAGLLTLVAVTSALVLVRCVSESHKPAPAHVHVGPCAPGTSC